MADILQLLASRFPGGPVPLVHSCDWASQPDIHIRCSDRWTTPAWTQPEGLPEGVHLDESGSLYTFADKAWMDPDSGAVLPTKVTCPRCHEMAEKGEGYREPK